MGINELMKIGTKIKDLRISKGLNQKEMAELLNLPRSTYSNYENNNREPDGNTLKKITRVLELPLHVLIPVNSIQMTISRIRRVRYEGKSIDEFASLLNIPKNELLDYESEIKKVTTDIIIKSAIILHVTLGDLIRDNDYSEYFNFNNITQSQITTLFKTHFTDGQSLGILRGTISKEDYDDLLIYIENLQQPLFDMEFKKKSQIFDLYKDITSIKEIEESVLIEIINGKELIIFLEYLYYKFSNEKFFE